MSRARVQADGRPPLNVKYPRPAAIQTEPTDDLSPKPIGGGEFQLFDFVN
jgi:hypothetical protein